MRLVFEGETECVQRDKNLCLISPTEDGAMGLVERGSSINDE